MSPRFPLKSSAARQGLLCSAKKSILSLMNPSILVPPVQRLFDSAKAQNQVEKQTKFFFFKSLAAKVNLAPSEQVSAADIYAVAKMDGILTTYRLFLLQALPQHGPNIYRVIMVEHLFLNQFPNIIDGVHEVDPQTGTYKQRMDLVPQQLSGEQIVNDTVLPFLLSTHILDGDSPTQPILRMLTNG